ncbi:hypothetical protein [Riemerella anatipestifer]|uniref:hypothetical protein n=1 Tax=Riemerella anatipestifer TaxID=34085 RepID=UPI0021AA45DA|nr:hypothetical protein [Riemerella anatipestifer]
MEQKFDIDKIVNYLDKYKSDLPKLYTWDAKIERLAELEVLTQKQIEEINKKKPYEKALHLKKIVGQNLKETYINDKTLFYEICLWIIRDWGGIFTANDNETIKLIESFLNKEVIEFQRIASISKVSSYLYPEKNIIYDSRVAYSLNWIILSENAGQKYFPIPKGRNSKMIAFDLNVLIRLKNISIYQPNEISDLDKKFFIKNLDRLKTRKQ